MEHVITILGARGSVPVSGSSYARYGGATTCVLVQMRDAFVVLDAGTGILSLPENVFRLPRLPLLLTHPHADHLLGLPMCPYVMRQGAQLDIYAAPRSGLDARGQIERLLAPPLWPIGPDALAANVYFHPLPETLRLGDIRVDTMEGDHPGGVSLFRLESDDKRVVFATDCTLSDALFPQLCEFAQNCDLLLCDGQYSDAEWSARKTFGHSTWTAAARFGADCGAKRVRVIHHDPGHTDAVLDAAAAEVRAIHPNCEFAREGEEIKL